MAQKKEKALIKIINLRQPVTRQISDLKDLPARLLGLDKDDIHEVDILRRSTDARQAKINYVFTLSAVIEVQRDVLLKILERKDVEIYEEKKITAPSKISVRLTRPVIVGCGPAGLFTAITLAERGIHPVVVERGERIAQRVKRVDSFWKKMKLDPESNTFFGEGGAGTFSDGKLTTRIKTPLKEKVLKELVKAGADGEILYLHKPHLGTDRLRRIIPRIVEELEKKGVKFLFNTTVRDIKIEGKQVKGLIAGNDLIKSEYVFLASGHSARDVYRLLFEKGVRLEPKGFAVGLRIEHPQELINRMQTGKWDGNQQTGPADYFFSYKDKISSRGVYTFCMCPGGSVIACSSSEGELCTNGMSTYSRRSSLANAAVVVTVGPDDFSGQDVLEGIEFQRLLEKAAFHMGGGNFFAPVQLPAHFLSEDSKYSDPKEKSCSYLPGVTPADLRMLLPEFIRGPLGRGLRHFEKKMPGFIAEGLLVGVETRTSSPVKILRNQKNFHAVGIRGLIPVGEGSGYAGGIVSSAVDGIRAAMQFDL